ncbi:plasmid mobilization relaxosome protein MobC [Algoriphagus sp. D3-2-R+10]|uniref:plasmid mobilization protein n=1 Tax=Algoriphagus aurantiacus TaxID=3103948 RepID=UPI002B39E7A2|nr:plasmid mobilization relaxosome protein MobC [Algoriphagus sp. D3-2-R+10]MEB2778114.1 plasmid mobilization relaxosome protein MobC [Algoriphagus sp. D3-2-R+10]
MKKRTVNYPVRKTIRFTQDEGAKLESLLKSSSYCQTTSELVRDILFKRKLTVDIRNESVDQLRFELGLVRSELNKIGVNINQITHYFHMQAGTKERLLFVREMLPHLERTKEKMNLLHGMIERLEVLK